MSTSGEVLFYGGSFNPPHIAHVLALAVALSTYEVDRILVTPTFKHPFAKALAPFDDRVAMCKLAMGWIPKVEISRVEEELGDESLTLRTIKHLATKHPDWKLRLLVGADIMVEAPKWHGFDEIARIAPPLVLGRIGIELNSAGPKLLPAVSSTDVRRLISQKDWAALDPLVPREVVRYLREHRLYEGQ